MFRKEPSSDIPGHRIYNVNVKRDVNFIASKKGVTLSTKAHFVVIKQVANEVLDSCIIACKRVSVKAGVKEVLIYWIRSTTNPKPPS